MLVRDWMTRDLISVPPSATLAQAAMAMAQHRVRRLGVVDHGALVGIVTKGDILHAAPPDLNPFSPTAVDALALDAHVFTVATTRIVTIAPEALIEDAATLMCEKHIGALPVVRECTPVGMVTRSNVFRALTSLLGADRPGLRLEFDVSANEDAVAFTVGLARKHRMQVASVATCDRGGHRTAVVRLCGVEPRDMVDEIWQTGHQVLSITRTQSTPAKH